MTEPLDPKTLERLAYTEAHKKHVRMIDLPAVARDVRLGTLHPRVQAKVMSTLPRPSVPKALAACPGPVVSESVAQVNRPLFPGDHVARIQAIVCDIWDVPLAAMVSERRAREWALPRQAAMVLCRELVPCLSLPRIGHRFGGRDHSTIMSAVERVAILTDTTEPKFNGDFARKYRKAASKARAALNLPVTP